MTEPMFPVFDAHLHFSQACLDQVMDAFRECGVCGGINLWNPRHGPWRRKLL